MHLNTGIDITLQSYIRELHIHEKLYITEHIKIKQSIPLGV